MRAYRIGDRVRVLKVLGVGPEEDARCANTVGVIEYRSECSDGIGFVGKDMMAVSIRGI